MLVCGNLHTASFVCHPYHVARLPLVARRTTSTWQGAGCQCRRGAPGLPRGVVAAGDDVKGTGSSSSVAGDVVLLLGSSVVDNVLCVVSFFLFPYVDVHRSDKPSRYFEWSPFFLLSQSHPGRLPISWLVFLLSIESSSR